MNREKQLFESELEILLKSDGDLSAAIRDFHDRYPDPNFRRQMVFFVLEKLIAQARRNTSVDLVDAELDKYVGETMALLKILEKIIKGGAEEEENLLLFCKVVRGIPGAQEESGKLSPWAKKLMLGGVGMVFQTGRERERSKNPPY